MSITRLIAQHQCQRRESRDALNRQHPEPVPTDVVERPSIVKILQSQYKVRAPNHEIKEQDRGLEASDELWTRWEFLNLYQLHKVTRRKARQDSTAVWHHRHAESLDSLRPGLL